MTDRQRRHGEVDMAAYLDEARSDEYCRCDDVRAADTEIRRVRGVFKEVHWLRGGCGKPILRMKDFMVHENDPV